MTRSVRMFVSKIVSEYSSNRRLSVSEQHGDHRSLVIGHGCVVPGE